MISCCWRCLSSLYFSFSAWICGASRCISCIDLSCLNVSGTSTARITTVSPTIASPQLPPTTLSWMNTMIDSNSLMRGEKASSMTLLARIGMRSVALGFWSCSRYCMGWLLNAWRSSRRARSGLARAPGTEQLLGYHRIVSAVAEGIAPEQAPGGKHEAPRNPKRADRLEGVAGARRLVLAAARDRRRDEPAVDDDRRNRDPARDAAHGTACPSGGRCRPARAISSARASSTPAKPSRSASSLAAGRATSTTSWSGRSSGSARLKASRSSRLRRFRCTAPPTLRETDSPRRGPALAVVGNAYSTRCRLAVERPLRYTRSNSALRDKRLEVRGVAEPLTVSSTGAFAPCRGGA